MFHVEANVNCYAVAEFLVATLNETQASEEAEEILERTRFRVTAEPVGDARIFVSVMPENVEPEILKVEEHEGAALPAQTEAIRDYLEAEIGRRVLLSIEKVAGKGIPKDRESIRAGVCAALEDDLFELLLPLDGPLQPTLAPVAADSGLTANRSSMPDSGLISPEEELAELIRLESKWIQVVESGAQITPDELKRYIELAGRDRRRSIAATPLDGVKK